MGLRDLPVRPGDATEAVKSAYVAELQAVATPDQLRAFTSRWRPLYQLTKKRPIDEKTEGAQRLQATQHNLEQLIAGEYDPVEALECIQATRAEGCKHKGQFACPGLHIVLPLVLMAASRIAAEYKVTTDVALIQMNGGFSALED
jgi:hypothetical protein